MIRSWPSLQIRRISSTSRQRPQRYPSSHVFKQTSKRELRRHFYCASTTLMLNGDSLYDQRFFQTSKGFLNENSEPRDILAYSSSIHRSVVGEFTFRFKQFLKWLLEVFIVSSRSLEVAARFCPLLVLSPTAVISDKLFENKGLSDFTWWYTLKTLQALGPAWQKLGQWAATRRDIFPSTICDRLSKLHDRGFPHPWEHTHAILEESFGHDYQLKGLKIDSSNGRKDALLGCGSAGQVYRGLLSEKDGSEKEVAIKVLHPSFNLLVERDVALMTAIANVLHSLPFQFIRVLNLPHVANDFSNILRQQADLRVEMRNLKRFRLNFYGPNEEHLKNSLVIFPRPIDDWTATNVLVEDLVHEAQPISDFLKDSSEEGLKIRRELAGPLLRSFLKMVFVDSWVHW